MALDRTDSIEWTESDALRVSNTDYQQILVRCSEEDRSDMNSMHDHRSECKEESRSVIEPGTTLAVSLSSHSNGSVHAKTKKKLSLTSFFKVSSDKKSSNSRSVATTPLPESSPRKSSSSQRSVKTSSDARSNNTSKRSNDRSHRKETSNSEQLPTIDKSEIKSCVSKQSSQSRKSSRMNGIACEHIVKSDIDWETLSLQAISIVHASKSNTDNKDVACNAIINAIALQSNNTNYIEKTTLARELSEVAAIASNMVLDEVNRDDTIKDGRKLASNAAKAILRAGAYAIKVHNEDEKDISTNLSSHLNKLSAKSGSECKEKVCDKAGEVEQSVVSNGTRKSSRSTNSSSTKKSSKSTNSSSIKKSSRSTKSSSSKNTSINKNSSNSLNVNCLPTDEERNAYVETSDSLVYSKDSFSIHSTKIPPSIATNDVNEAEVDAKVEKKDSQRPKENKFGISISQFLNQNDTTRDTADSGGNTVHSLFERFYSRHSTEAQRDDTMTL